MRDHRLASAVEDALEGLRGAIKQHVRAEQLRDKLTGLGNDDALTEWLDEQIENENTFWIAFIEVDRFKNLNDRFGYDNADLMLIELGQTLRGAAKSHLDGAVPFRAHGDEFYIAGGVLDPEIISRALEHLRNSVRLLRVPKAEPMDKLSRPSVMECTVSIGWLASDELLETEQGLTARSVKSALERAVAAAKRERDTVIRFAPTMVKVETTDGRADWPECEARFSVTIPAKQRRAAGLTCPNCASTVERPPSLMPTTGP